MQLSSKQQKNNNKNKNSKNMHSNVATSDSQIDSVEKQEMLEKKPASPTTPASSPHLFSPTTPAPSKKEKDPNQELFFFNSPFYSWPEYFTATSKVSNPPKGTAIGWFDRIEMALILFACFATNFIMYQHIFHTSHDLKSVLSNSADFTSSPESTAILALSEEQLERKYYRLADNKLPTIIIMLLKPFLPDVENYKYDVADHQWRAFDSNLHVLIAALFVFVGVSQLFARFTNSKLRIIALAVMSVGFVLYVHSYGAVMLLAILTGHYLFTVHLGKILPRWLFLAIMWIVLTGTLIAIEWNEGFDLWFKSTFPIIADMFPKGSAMMRWNAVFNMQILRLIAFSVDYLEARDVGETRAREVEKKHKTTCFTCGQIAMKSNPNGKLIASEIQPLCYKARTDTPRSIDEYSFLNFIAYILYLPLYIGGPISSFNAFISHIKTAPSRAMTVKELARYAFRVICLYYSTIVKLHLCYLTSIKAQDFIVSAMPPIGMAGLMLMMLAFLWLKFSVIWKGFRFFGMLDGVEAPEDMVKCWANTVRVAEFWRNWHASFNLWIVRYMYIPLGGNKYKAFVVFPIFFFIAIWHDSKLELLSWALIMCLNFVIETILTAYCTKVTYWKRSGYERHWTTLGGMYTILSLMVANAIGFGTGHSSAGFVSKYMTAEYGYLAMFWTLVVWCICSISLMDREIDRNKVRKWNDELKLALEEKN